MSLRSPLTLDIAALVRTSVQACGFVPGDKQRRAYMRMQGLFGQMLRRVSLPWLLSAHARFSPAAYAEVGRTDPYLWQRLAAAAAFGHSQGRLLSQLLGPHPADRMVAESCALLNTTVTVYDYLVDECRLAAEIEALAGRRVVWQLLLDDPAPALSDLDRAADRAADGRVRLLICLMTAWVRHTTTFPDFQAHSERWRQLYRMLHDLFEAELATRRFSTDTRPSSEWMAVLATKSAGPSRVCALLAAAARPARHSSGSFLEVADCLGQVFWLADDLSDVARDLASGAPNRVTLGTSAVAPGSTEASLEHIAEAIGVASDELCRVLNRLERLLGQHAQPEAAQQLLEWTRAYVSDWLGLAGNE